MTMSDFDEAADMAKYDNMRAELEAEGRLEPRESQVAEEHTTARPDHGQQDYQQHQQYDSEIPEVLSDPLAHFDARSSRLENHAATRQLYDALQADERAAESEMSDYWQACEHLEAHRMRELERQIPDGQQGDLLARSHGFRTAAEARQAHLNRDRQLVVQHAMQTGQSAAAVYYGLAVQRAGYKPTVVPRSLHQQVRQAKGQDYDKAWDVYAKASRRADENYKARR